MSVYASSDVATLEALALVKGPHSGASGAVARRPLRLLDASVVLAVGVITAAGHTIRLGILPKGAKIVPRATELSSSHTADIAGKLIFTPVSGATGTQELTGVSVEINTTPAASIPPTTAAIPELLEDCWVEFVPTADTTIAATDKTMKARIVYSTPH